MTDTIDKPALAATCQRRMAREPQSNNSPNQNAAASVTSPPVPEPKKIKARVVLDLLSRAEGATPDQMIAATGWLPHTVRAALTGLKKQGNTIERRKVDGQTTYFQV